MPARTWVGQLSPSPPPFDSPSKARLCLHYSAIRLGRHEYQPGWHQTDLNTVEDCSLQIPVHGGCSSQRGGSPPRVHFRTHLVAPPSPWPCQMHTAGRGNVWGGTSVGVFVVQAWEGHAPLPLTFHPLECGLALLQGTLRNELSPGWIGASSRTPKGCRFNLQSGHIPRLQVRSLVRDCLWEATGQCFFLSLKNQ